MAARASGNAPFGVAANEQLRRLQGGAWRSLDRHRGIESGNLDALVGTELAGDPAHLRMLSATVGKTLQLPLKVAGIERCEPGRTPAIALAAKPMAGKARALSTGAAAAQGDKLTRFLEPVARRRLQLGAAGKGDAGDEGSWASDRAHFHTGTGAAPNRFPLAISLISAFAMCTAACKPPPERNQSFPTASAERGKRVIEKVGCASCHTISGIGWPQGRVAPQLRGLDGRALIAGEVSNSPENLAAFVRNAPAVIPGTTMPKMPLNEQESRDVAAYLYEIGD